jgi:hypothetical protein
MSTYENRPYAKHHDYTVFTSEINLVEDENGPSDGKGGRKPGPARRVAVLEVGSGTLALRYSDGSEETHTITAAQIGTQDAAFEATFIQAILPATNVSKVRVGW